MTTTVTKTIRASGGDYTTLSAWEAALPADISQATGVDQKHIAVCYNDWPSGLADTVTVAGVTTDSIGTVTITVADGHWHESIPGQGFYLKGPLTNQISNVTYEKLQVRRAGISFQTSVGSPTVIYDSCIGEHTTGTSTYVFVSTHSGNNAASWQHYRNCLAIGRSGLGTGFGNSSNSSRGRGVRHNCVATGLEKGFVASYADTLNCIAYGCTTDIVVGWATYNCATSDATGNITGITSAEFVDAANYDFHLASGSSLIGAGTNLYATFDHDIDGDIRPSSGAWDIGFDHYASAASAVYSDLTDAYALRAAASGDLTDSYVIRAAITQDLADSYSVRAAIAQDLADSYAITASVAADASDSYVIRAAIAQDLADSYALRAAIAQDLADSYSIESAGTVTSDLLDGYAIRAATTSDLADSYDIHTAVTADLSDAANIRAAVAADIEDAYTIVAAVAADLVDTALIRAAATADLADNYTIAAQPGACPSADTIAEAVWAHATGAALAVRLAEAWGRLGLDPSKPLVSGQTEISFGDVVMALTGNETSSTLTRQ